MNPEHYFDPSIRNNSHAIAAASAEAMALFRSAANLSGLTLDAGPGFFAQRATTDTATGGGLAYLQSQLQKLDPKVREPLTSVTWFRDIPIEDGGGWVDFTSNDFVNYGVAGPNQYGLSGNATSQIPVVSADLQRDIYRVANWQNIVKIPMIDQFKAQSIGRSLSDLLDKGVRLNWNKSLDLIAYQGWLGYPGLVNNSNITAGTVANGGSGTQWTTKTPAQILTDINTLLVATLSASQYDLTGMGANILIPWSQYGYITTQPVTAAGNQSILTYLEQNNIASKMGVEFSILPLRWCSGAGSGSTDRMIGYARNRDRLQMDITVPASRFMTLPVLSSDTAAYVTLYAGQIGVLKILYYTSIQYADGI